MLVPTAALLVIVGILAAGQAPESPEPVGREMCLSCHEVSRSFLGSVHGTQECETCHGIGAAHVEAGGDPELIRGAAWSGWNGSCLACHSVGERGLADFERSVHGRNQVDCLECHAVHPAQGGFKLLRSRPVDLCITCHASAEADFRKPFHHPVLEGGVSCIDCHSPHSDARASHQRLEISPEFGCTSCHADKKGPFVFDHAPVAAGECQVCHTSHGGFNSKLLIRSQVHQLCLECHSLAPGVATSQPPSIHDLRSPRWRSCTTCHREIHGSNNRPDFIR